MKGMYWVWLGALLMGIGIVGMMELASSLNTEPIPVFATEQTVYTEPTAQ